MLQGVITVRSPNVMMVMRGALLAWSLIMAPARRCIIHDGRARLRLFDERCRAATVACLGLTVLLAASRRFEGHSGARLLSTCGRFGTQRACVNLVTASLLVGANIIRQASLIKVRC